MAKRPEQETPSLVTYVRQQIERRIISGELRPGARLEEKTMATELDVSRTPVREALRQLLAARLIEQSPNRTAIVAMPSRNEISNLFETTAELEAVAARFSAGRIREMDKSRLIEARDACEKMLQANEQAAYGKFNEQYHDLICTSTGNPSLRDVVHSLRIRLAPFRHAQFSDSARMKESNEEHMRITAAILAGNGDEAAEEMRMHINNAGVSVLNMLFQNTHA